MPARMNLNAGLSAPPPLARSNVQLDLGRRYRHGSRNQGNTCYLNSVLAALTHCRPFAQTMLVSPLLSGVAQARQRFLGAKFCLIRANGGSMEVKWADMLPVLLP